MSGGDLCDYGYFQIEQIAEAILKEIRENKIEWEYPQGYGNKRPVPLEKGKYKDEVLEKFKEGFCLLKKAAIYAQRIDWLVSGDDSEETFLERLDDELNLCEIEIDKIKSKNWYVNEPLEDI